MAHTAPERDPNGEATHSALYAIDLVQAQPTLIAEFDTWAPLATWSDDADWVLLIRGRDLELVNLRDGTSISLPDAVPEEHFVLGVG